VKEALNLIFYVEKRGEPVNIEDLLDLPLFQAANDSPEKNKFDSEVPHVSSDPVLREIMQKCDDAYHLMIKDSQQEIALKRESMVPISTSLEKKNNMPISVSRIAPHTSTTKGYVVSVVKEDYKNIPTSARDMEGERVYF